MYAQGCSDAGFCTLGAMKPNQAYSKKINIRVRSIEVSVYYGESRHGLQNVALNGDVNIGISKKFTAQIKLPYQYLKGKLATKDGVGDVSLAVSYNLVGKETYQINLSLGGKIPTGAADATVADDSAGVKIKNRALPMYYQTTLGTYDILGGISLITRGWLFATGFQYDITENKNDFLWGRWNGSSSKSISDNYAKSRQLHRGFDVMWRIEKNLRFSNWNAYLGLLWIHRITKDTFLDVDNKRREIEGSDGAAVTLLGGLGYRFDVHWGIKLLGGYGLMDRAYTQYKTPAINQATTDPVKKNPDGLSRAFVITTGLEYRF
ncbi:MAG: hypothetical protein NW207_02445 [Cytophagales bacterium]|nr:hypothetical protein [Cytophagales bacterium]